MADAKTESWGDDPIQSMSAMPKSDFSALMDKTFGKGKWRLTGGFRTPEREEELRSEGAETVKPGATSAHSTGTEEDPGAFDVVVDGLSPAAVADKLGKSGQKFRKLYPEGASGSQGGHLHVEPYLTDADWGDDALVTPGKKPEAEGEVFHGSAKDLSATMKRFVKPETPRERLVRNATEPVRNIPKDIATEYHAAAEGNRDVVRQGVQRMDERNARIRSGHPEVRDFLPDFHALTDTAQMAGNSLAQMLSPITGSAHALVGRPVENATGSRMAGQLAEGAATLAVPVAAEAKLESEAARIARESGITRGTARAVAERRAATPAPANTLKAVTEETPHSRDVKLMHENGIRMSPGQISGGVDRVNEEKMMSDPNRGYAIHERVNQSLDDFDRAMYRKSLKLIGEDYPKDGPVGEQAVDHLFSVGEQRYEALKPKIHLKETEGLKADFDRALNSIGPEALAERADLKHILDTRILPGFQNGRMDGQAFKDAESHLTKEAGRLRLGTPYQQREAEAIDDVLASLRNNAEQHSDPAVTGELKSLNAYWASINRISDAAYSAKAQGGRFTPNQMLTAAGKGGRYQRRMVARGKAFDQDFISAAQRVLPNNVPNSGTADRALANRGLGRQAGAAAGATAGGALAGPPGAGLGAVIGGGLGGAADRAVAPQANRLAAVALERSAQRRLAHQGIETRNYLKAAQQRARALPPPAVIAGAAAALPHRSDQP